MEVTKPVHFTLIVIATLMLLLYLVLDWSPRIQSGDAAFRALQWATRTARLTRAVGCYLGFSVVVLGHAICSHTLHPPDATQELGRDK